MSSYVITGVSRGLGWELLKQISDDGKNTVIGIVRNKAPTVDRIANDLSDRSNITILEADLTDYDALKNAAADTSRITGGKLDYLIANAGYVPQWDAYSDIGILAENPTEMAEQFHMLMNTNVLANIYLYSVFMPQILQGNAKKVLAITSGHSDIDIVNKFDIYHGSLYATSKAAMNMINAKFSTRYKQYGVLFLGICPGAVDTGHIKDITLEQMNALKELFEKFQQYAPNFTGPDTPPEAIKAVLSVLEQASIQNGDGGAYLSHFGNKQWL